MNTIINEAVFAALFNSPAGPVARKLEREGARVVDAAKVHIGQAAPSPVPRTWRNPPPGPPMLRSGDLQASLTSLPAQIGPLGLEVLCVAPAAHRGFAYGELLIQRDYEFVNLAGLV